MEGATEQIRQTAAGAKRPRLRLRAAPRQQAQVRARDFKIPEPGPAIPNGVDDR